MDICQSRSPSPNAKIIKNLCAFACCDADHTPNVLPVATPTTPPGGGGGGGAGKGRRGGSEEGGEREAWHWSNGIISLSKLQQDVRGARTYITFCVRTCFSESVCVFVRVQTSRSKRKASQGRGRPSAATKEAMAVTAVEQQQRKVSHRKQTYGIS